MRNEKILIVEDDEDIRELIHFHLFKNNFEVIEAANGSDALKLAQEEKPDLILLDIMLPLMDGIEVCEKLKKSADTKELRIIFLSARGEEEDIVRGLELGAEDYITKPFSPKVLMAKIKTILRRQALEDKKEKTFFGIKIDDKKRKVIIDNKEISLTPSEFQLLNYLFSSPGHVFTRGQIVNHIKGVNHAITDRSVDTQLVSLRKKMGEKASLIESVWGVGYRFKDIYENK